MASPVNVVLFKANWCCTCFAWESFPWFSDIWMLFKITYLHVITWWRWIGVVWASHVAALAMAKAGVKNFALWVWHQGTGLALLQMILKGNKDLIVSLNDIMYLQISKIYNVLSRPLLRQNLRNKFHNCLLQSLHSSRGWWCFRKLGCLDRILLAYTQADLLCCR